MGADQQNIRSLQKITRENHFHREIFLCVVVVAVSVVVVVVVQSWDSHFEAIKRMYF